MKSSIITDKDLLLNDLKSLKFYSQFLCVHDKKQKKKIIKELKKLIKHVEDDNVEEYMKKEWVDEM